MRIISRHVSVSSLHNPEIKGTKNKTVNPKRSGEESNFCRKFLLKKNNEPTIKRINPAEMNPR